MTTLEDKLTALLDDRTLSRDELVCELSKTVLQHFPKKRHDWGNYLRRIAAYIDSRPEPRMLSAKTIGALLELGDFK